VWNVRLEAAGTNKKICKQAVCKKLLVHIVNVGWVDDANRDLGIAGSTRDAALAYVCVVQAFI
jgi:hypothetical protein